MRRSEGDKVVLEEDAQTKGKGPPAIAAGRSWPLTTKQLTLHVPTFPPRQNIDLRRLPYLTPIAVSNWRGNSEGRLLPLTQAGTVLRANVAESCWCGFLFENGEEMRMVHDRDDAPSLPCSGLCAMD